jgi:transcriptional regulator with XRE-family HTH domain
MKQNSFFVNSFSLQHKSIFALAVWRTPNQAGRVSRESALETLGEVMRHVREVAGVSLTATAQVTGVSKGHLSNVERGRDCPGWELVAYYEDRFGADGQLWAAYVEVAAGPRPRQRANREKPARYPLAGDASEFIDDVTIPDVTVMPPGFRFEKTWRIRNVGSVRWVGRWLRRLGAPAGLGIPSSPIQVRIADTLPGETVDIIVPMKAHILPGTAEVHWKMVDDKGYEFFPDRYYQGLFITIVVREGAPEPMVRRIVDDADN